MTKVKRTLEEILEFAKDKIDKASERKLIKTMKMKPEWKKLHDEVIALKKEVNLMLNKAESISDEKWAKIRRETNYPPYDLQISDDGTELRMYEDEE